MGPCALARGFTGGGLESPIQVHRREYCTQRAHVLFFHFFQPYRALFTVATEDVFLRLNTEVAVCFSVCVCVCTQCRVRGLEWSSGQKHRLVSL